MILLNIEGFGHAPILVKTDRRLIELNDCNLLNTEALVLGGLSSSSLLSISSTEMRWTADCLFFHRPEILIGYSGA